MVFGGPVLPPFFLIKEASESLEDFRKAHVSLAVPVNDGQGSHGRWINPALSCIKINWDAALDGRKKIMSMEIVPRGCMGVVKAAMCAVIPYIRDPMVAEAIGARRAVEFGREMGYYTK